MKLPLPFLYQHNSREPIGHIVSAKKNKDGLVIKAQIAAAGLISDVDKAWSYIKAGLVRGLSIGFRSLEHAWMDDSDGIRFIRSELFEISAVTIPANSSASILTVKSADNEVLTALGDRRSGVVRLDTAPERRFKQRLASELNLPGDSGLTRNKGKTMTIADQIKQFEAKRAANVARMTDIMDKAGDAGTTLDAAQEEEHDTLQSDVESIDKHLVRLKAHEKTLIANAVAVTSDNTKGADKAGSVRAHEPITVRSNHEKGIGMARVAIAMIAAKGNPFYAAQLAEKHWKDMPEVALHLKANIDAGDTTTSGWASQLITTSNLTGEFVDMLRAATILGRIPGLKKVPFNVSVPIQTGGGTYQWVGEGANKPVTKLTLGSVTLRWAKAAGIIVITKELATFSSPSAELLVRNELLEGLTRFFDTAFVSTTAEVTNVSPAGILNGITPTIATGTTAARFRYDLNTMMQLINTDSQDPSKFVILMGPGIAMAVGSMVNALGQTEFPSINMTGGNFNGVPIITSSALGTNIVALNASEILVAEDGGITVDVSDQATVEMDSEPLQGETSPLTNAGPYKSLWQSNCVGLRAERFITWKRARASAVQFISAAGYTPPTS